MSQKLCWKCRRYFGAYSMSELTSHLHCHHPEPEEKPKCWCEEEHQQTMKIRFLDERGNSEYWGIPKFCPECGKKLEAVNGRFKREWRHRIYNCKWDRLNPEGKRMIQCGQGHARTL